jgi:hypothetical protein
VTAVVGVEGAGVTVPVGDEGVGAEDREERRPGVGLLRAADDETVAVAIRRLGRPSLATVVWSIGVQFPSAIASIALCTAEFCGP